MTDRSSMDRPATAVAATLGVVLIVASAALFYFTGTGAGGTGASGTEYTVLWSEVALGANQAQLASGSPASVEADDDAPSNATVVLDCNDQPGTPARGAARVSFELTDSNGTVFASENDVPCGDGTFGPYPLGGHPDVASVEAGSLDAARAETWQDARNTTTTYSLRYSITRAASPTDPLPQAVPASVTGTIRLEVEEWAPAVTESADEEVVR